jgi:electron transfer flavoprotein alpha subunit
MILVLLEVGSDNSVTKASLCAISAANKLKKPGLNVSGLILGKGTLDTVAAAYAEYGLDEVLVNSNDVFANYLALPFAQQVAQIVSENKFTYIVAASSTLGKDLMPRVAGLLDIGLASDVLEVLDDGLFRRPMFAGNILADVEVLGDVKALTIRQTAFDAQAKATSKSPIRNLELAAPSISGQSFVSFDTVKSERPELSDAEIVVSGGRALKSKENFDQYIMPLADKLGAAVGASRAAVDAGYAPNDWQVGQTGKVVAPKLYIAVGISGAIQHLAGMKDSKVIVAINKDPEAPIFEVADYGLVADLYEAVPLLIDML